MCGEEKKKRRTNCNSRLDPVWLEESLSLKLQQFSHPSQCLTPGPGDQHQEVKPEDRGTLGQ